MYVLGFSPSDSLVLVPIMSLIPEKLLQLRKSHEDGVAEYSSDLDAGCPQRSPRWKTAACNSLARESLKLAMLRFCIDSDPDGCDRALREASRRIQENIHAGIDQWERATEGRAGSTLYLIESFLPSVCVHVLSHHWEQANILMRRLFSSRVVVNNGMPDSEFSALIMALLCGDGSRLSSCLQALKDWNGNSIRIYLELGELAGVVMAGDQVGLNKLLSRAEKNYRRREKISAASSYEAGLGTDGYNLVYFDYITVIICMYARRTGLTVETSTPAVPNRHFFKEM